jgi:hypothetical protein
VGYLCESQALTRLKDGGETARARSNVVLHDTQIKRPVTGR